MAEPLQSQMPIKPDQIIDILLRRKWLIIIPLCITLTLGLYYTLTTQRTYQASTLILVQAQRVPTSYVRSVVSSSINERISTISQQILSRSNIEKIIDEFGLFQDEPGMYLEDKIASMRKRVHVKTEKTDRRGSEAEAFSISFSGSNPQQVMRITNTLASYFMDENLKVREAQAIATSDFLESELEKTRERLEQREQQLATYRENHMGGLPDELDSNLRTLDRIQQQIANKQALLQQSRNALGLIQAQIAQAREMASIEEETSPLLSEDEQKLAAAREEYDEVLTKYTDKHPDVRRLEKIIEKLEAAVARNQEENDTESETGLAAVALPPDIKAGFFDLQQEAQVKQLQGQIQRLESDISRLEQQMAIYEQRVVDTPKRELELQSLRRDYANIQNIYNSILDRKLEAELSVNMEKKQKGEQFRILDHARLPEKPTSPDVKKLFLLSLALGLGAGAGIVFLLEFLNNTIRSEDVIEADLGLTLLARIPPLKKPGQTKKKILDWTAFCCATLYAVVFLALFAILNWKGLDRASELFKNTLNI